MEQKMRRVGRTNIAMALLLENTEFIIVLLSKSVARDIPWPYLSWFYSQIIDLIPLV